MVCTSVVCTMSMFLQGMVMMHEMEFKSEGHKLSLFTVNIFRLSWVKLVGPLTPSHRY